MNIAKWFSATVLMATLTLSAAVPELVKLVPESKDYELICKTDLLQYGSLGYQVDNTDSYSGTLKRVGYFLKLTDKQGKMTWVFVSMDPFAQELNKIGVPNFSTGVLQTYVTNLKVRSNSPALKTGDFPKGNIEFWLNNYGGPNVKRIPGATKECDFGDNPWRVVDGYGSMQVHNYLNKQTVFAFNHIRANGGCDLGIGNNTTGKGDPDWTRSYSGNKYKSAELYIVGKFNNLKIQKTAKFDVEKASFQKGSGKLFYAPGEPMKFIFSMNYGNQPPPAKPYFVKWIRTGDDGKRENGQTEISQGKPVVVTTRLDRPGFVRLQAWLLDDKGRNIKFPQKVWNTVRYFDFFDGGAGVQPEKLQPAVKEPVDFDAFWAKQKQKLSAVPVKYKMTKVKTKNGVDIYAVSVDCAAPRPVTGYLTVPVGAKDKSLAVKVSFDGYSASVKTVPVWAAKDMIYFKVNAHGYDLGKDEAYYKEFFAGIKSNGKNYAFDPEQNSDPEKAYFNGMALRVMRSLQFVKKLPQWNGKDLLIYGGSQGGLQAVWAAALDPDVTDVDSYITWCCDVAGPTQGRLKSHFRPSYVPALNYYDCVFHAKRIHCKIFISRAGLGDYTCPPSGLAILYNNIASKDKSIKWVQGSTHIFIPRESQTLLMKSK